MEIKSFTENLDFNTSKVVTKVILETPFSKEIRILLKKGQFMKEHRAPFPIIVHILEGQINFSVEGRTNLLKKGNIITLESNVNHDLKALEDSVIRLTLAKADDVLRVKKVINKA